MKIKMHGYYDHFPNHVPLPFEGYIDCYNDWSIREEPIERNSIALMIEPRSLQPDNYTWIEHNSEKFRYIFTHDSRLLYTLPNAKLILWGWGNENYMCFSDEPKTKLCSLISSDKEYCELHKVRKQLAYDLQDQIDCYGTFNGGKFVDTHTAHAPYMFAVILENHKDNYWFTEKVMNCFSNKVVPIYYGAEYITDYFNKRGMIIVNKPEYIPYIIEHLSENGDEEYYKRIDAINDNYERANRFKGFEDWFFDRYENLLEGILNV